MGLVMAGYLIKYGDEILYRPGDDFRPAHSASLSMRTDSVSTLTITIPPTHVIWASETPPELSDFENPVRVWFDNELLFQGFISRMTQNLNTETTLHCESELAWLAWVHTRIEDHPQGNGTRRVYTAPQLFKKLIDFYNYYLEDSTRAFTIGHTLGASDVGYYDSEADKVVVDAAASTPTTLLDLLKKSILDPYNCQIRVWYSGSTRYIGLYTSAPTSSNQVIRFGENLTQFTSDLDTTEMYTGCIPVGGSVREYKREHDLWLKPTQNIAEGTSTLKLNSSMGYSFTIQKGAIITLPAQGGYTYQVKSESVTLPVSGSVDVKIEGTTVGPIPATNPRTGQPNYGFAVPRGTEYETSSLTLSRITGGWWDARWYKDGEIVYDRALAETKGLKTFTFSDPDILLADDLMRKAIAELEQRMSPTFTLNVDGVDMALYMPGYTHLLAGQTVRVVSPPHGIDVVMQVTSADLNLDDPGATRYTIGPIPKTATEKVRDARRDTVDVRDMLTFDINDVVTGSQIMGLN